MNLPKHELTMTVLMTPDLANFSGNVHGGTVLKLLDQVAYACASRYAGRYVVTLSVDQVIFRELEDLRNIPARWFRQRSCLLGQIRLSTLPHQHQKPDDPTAETEPFDL